MDGRKPDDRHCFACGRDLGPRLEWRKMVTDEGPICYECFNLAMAEEREKEKR
jgi:hypothetical protein